MLKKLQRLADGLPGPIKALVAPVRWLFSMVRRADLVLLEGRARDGGAPMALAFCGPVDLKEYLSRKAFDEPVTERRLGRAFIWLASARARALAPEADLLLVYAPPLLEGIVSGGSLAGIPVWIRMDVDLSADDGGKQSKLGRARSKAAKGGYAPRLASDEAAMRDFIDRLHLPFVRARHGETAHEPDEAELRAGLERGNWELLLIERDGTALAGVTLDYTASVARFRQIGVRDASPELLAERISDVCYAFMLDHVKAKGAPLLDLGSCRPFVTDGVVEYKRQFGGFVSERQERASGLLHIKALKLGPGAVAWLTANPFVAREASGRDYLCAFVARWDEAARLRLEELGRRFCGRGGLTRLEAYVVEGEPGRRPEVRRRRLALQSKAPGPIG